MNAESQFDPSKLFAPAEVRVSHREDGTTVLSSPLSLGDGARCVGDWLCERARSAPERLFLMERGPEGAWQGVSYAAALRVVRQIGSWLLSVGCTSERPVAILSDNSVKHALLSLAAMHVGVPACSVSSAYSLVSSDFAKLRAVIAQLTPGVIYAADELKFSAALAAVRSLHDGIVVADQATEDGSPIVPWSDLTRGVLDHDAVDRAFAAISPDTVAKLLFTSGSTGSRPKAVITTQRMLVINQEQMARVWPFLEEQPPILLDWLPWSHTFGGSHNFNMVLRNGGTLYIDAGRPVPQRFAQTLTNLREIAPTLYFNVPRGFDMLLSALREDPDLRQRFFANLRLMFCAAAALPHHIWTDLKALGASNAGRAIPLITAWGSTETAPLATSCYFEASSAGVIGLPVPGVELKLVPQGPKLEVRVRGPNVSPGYWRRPDLSPGMFDSEGFYVIGDAVKAVDPTHYERGLLFDGRISEDFKLSSGTWVNAGSVRLRAIAALAPLVQDAVVTGHDRDEIGLLLFPNVAACREHCPSLPSEATLEQVLAHPQIREKVRRGLLELRANGTGSSTYATRAVLMAEPASIDAGEITDKGYINQRMVLERRKPLVERLSSKTPPDESIGIGSD